MVKPEHWLIPYAIPNEGHIVDANLKEMLDKILVSFHRKQLRSKFSVNCWVEVHFVALSFLPIQQLIIVSFICNSLLALLNVFLYSFFVGQFIQPIPKNLRVLLNFFSIFANVLSNLSPHTLTKFLTSLDKILKIMSSPVYEAGAEKVSFFVLFLFSQIYAFFLFL